MTDWVALATVLAPAGIVGGCMWAILRGRLVPRRTLDDYRADLDAERTDMAGRIADHRTEVTYWRDAYRIQADNAQAVIAQTSALMEASRTTQDLLRAIVAAATTRPGPGGGGP